MPPTRPFFALESELGWLIRQEEIVWKQRSRVWWLNDGDLNTSYFHRISNSKHVDDETEILQIFTNHYKNLHQGKGSTLDIVNRATIFLELQPIHEGVGLRPERRPCSLGWIASYLLIFYYPQSQIYIFPSPKPLTRSFLKSIIFEGRFSRKVVKPFHLQIAWWLRIMFIDRRKTMVISKSLAIQ